MRRRLAREEKSAETGDAPATLEIVGFHARKIARHVVAGVEDGEIDRTRRFRLAEEFDDVFLLRRIALNGRCPAARAGDGVGDRLHLLEGAARDENMKPLPRRLPCDCRAETFMRPDADDDCRFGAHGSPPSLLRRKRYMS